jgi:hypothetical protein
VRTGVIKREKETEHEGSEKKPVHALLEITCDTENDKNKEEIIKFKFTAILL